MFSIVVMSTMLLAALGSVGAVAKSRVSQQQTVQGLALARQLMSEIVQTRYKDLVNPVFGVETDFQFTGMKGTLTAETRATYDDVDDYHGLIEPSARYSNGTVIAGGTGWARSVSVQWVNAANPATTSGSDAGLKKITVTVTSPTGRVTTLSGFRSAENGYEHTPAAQVTYTSHVGVTLRIGKSATVTNVQGVALSNMVP